MSIRDKDIWPDGKEPNMGRKFLTFIALVIGSVVTVGLGFKYGWW